MSPESLGEHEKGEQDLQHGRGAHARWVGYLPTDEMRGERQMSRANEVERKRNSRGQKLSRIWTEVLVIEIERAHIHVRPANVPPLSCGRIKKGTTSTGSDERARATCTGDRHDAGCKPQGAAVSFNSFTGVPNRYP